MCIILCRHVLLKYGKSRVSAPQVKSRSQRVEKLKQMYKRGMDIDTAPTNTDQAVTREGEGEGEDSGEEEQVDQLLKWTENLDEQVLSTTPVLNTTPTL